MTAQPLLAPFVIIIGQVTLILIVGFFFYGILPQLSSRLRHRHWVVVLVTILLIPIITVVNSILAFSPALSVSWDRQEDMPDIVVRSSADLVHSDSSNIQSENAKTPAKSQENVTINASSDGVDQQIPTCEDAH